MTKPESVNIKGFRKECSCGKVVKGFSEVQVEYRMKQHKQMSKNHNKTGKSESRQLSRRKEVKK